MNYVNSVAFSLAAYGVAVVAQDQGATGPQALCVGLVLIAGYLWGAVVGRFG